MEMLLAALILIIAILLFGSAAVKGFINGTVTVLFCIAAIGGLAYLIASAFDLSGAEVFIWLIGGGAALIFGSAVVYGIACTVLGIDPATGEKRR